MNKTEYYLREDLRRAYPQTIGSSNDFLKYSRCIENDTVFWHSADTEALFDKHQKNIVTRIHLKKLGWTKDSVTYKFNEDGFRGDSFSDSSGAIFMGCSVTFGVGLPYENTWPYLVSKKLNLSCWNLGQPASSLDTCYRLAKYWVPVLKPKYIFILTPTMYRREFYDDDKDRFIHIGGWSYDRYPVLVDYILASEKNSIINYEKNIDAIKYISDSHKIPLIILDYESDDVPSVADPFEKYKLARDLSHPGIDFHKHLSDDMVHAI